MNSSKLSIIDYSQKQTILWLLVTLVLVFFADLIGFVGWLKTPLTLLANPVQVQIRKSIVLLETPARTLIRGYKAGLRVQDLELRYSEVVAQLGRLQQVEAENQTLRAMIENADRTLDQVVVTSPLVSFAKPAVSYGSLAGAREGMAVVADGTLLGRLSKVEQTSAEVSLLRSRDGIPVVAKTELGVEGLIVGDGRRILLTELPADAAIAPGQAVLTVGQVGLQPGLLIGRVQSVTADAASATQTAIIQQAVSFYETNIVEVYQ